MKFYTLFLLMAMPFVALSQSVISNVVPNFGDQFVMAGAELAPSPGEPGANVIWDFSGLTIDASLVDYTVVLPSEVEGSEIFPDASMVWLAGVGDMVLEFYMDFENNTFTEHGSKTEFSGFVSGIQYTNPIDHFTFPLSYLDTGSDTYIGDAFGDGGNTPLILGTESYVIDGWGTITTPFGTFANVLRITHTAVDSIQSALNSVIYTTETSWYSVDYPIPVMVITTDITVVPGIPSETSETTAAMVSYTPASTTGLADRDNQNNFNIYPNPASDQITLTFDDIKGNAVLNIYSSTGKLVETSSIQSHQKTDISALSPGLYIAVILVDGKRYTQKPFSVVR